MPVKKIVSKKDSAPAPAPAPTQAPGPVLDLAPMQGLFDELKSKKKLPPFRKPSKEPKPLMPWEQDTGSTESEPVVDTGNLERRLVLKEPKGEGLTIEKIDRYLALMQEKKELEKDIKALEKIMEPITKELTQAAIGTDATEPHVFSGSIGRVVAQACRANTTIKSMPEVRSKLESIKPGLFLELASVGIGDLKKYLSESELEMVTVKTLSSSRVFKIEI